MDNDMFETEWAKTRKPVDVVVGLFGTCGGSKWRDAFIDKYEQFGISYFNPVVQNWTPDDAVRESQHLASDDIILFPVTGETYGFGSLAEIGFAVAQIVASTNRVVIVYVERTLDENLENPRLTDSQKARALVAAHLSKVSNPRVVVVDSLDAMLEKSLRYHDLIREWKERDRAKVVY